ncbi:MAG TPA: hypothetical protein VMF67_02420 [Rhizomicrobium sp.]|nr:hypothetical protein [Rhizomicrobium sp.]
MNILTDIEDIIEEGWGAVEQIPGEAASIITGVVASAVDFFTVDQVQIAGKVAEAVKTAWAQPGATLDSLKTAALNTLSADETAGLTALGNDALNAIIAIAQLLPAS